MWKQFQPEHALEHLQSIADYWLITCEGISVLGTSLGQGMGQAGEEES